MRISDWSSDVCSSDLKHLPEGRVDGAPAHRIAEHEDRHHHVVQIDVLGQVQAEQRAARYALQPVLAVGKGRLQKEEEHHLRHGQRDHRKVDAAAPDRSEEHTSELQSLMRNSYAVLCLKKKK